MVLDFCPNEYIVQYLVMLNRRPSAISEEVFAIQDGQDFEFT